MTAKKKTVWETLTTNEVKVAVDEHRQQKGNLDYLSWAWAWGKLKDHFPDASFEKHWFEDGPNRIPYTFDKRGFAYVQVTVTVEGSSLTEILPVLNHNNKPVTNPDSFQVNTALQRCFCKAIPYHGLGFHIYAGEDLQDYTPDNPVVVDTIADTIDLPAETKGEALVKEASNHPLVQAVEDIGGEIKGVGEKIGYKNVFDDKGRLIHGFDDEDSLAFKFVDGTSLEKQEDYVDKHIDTILKSISNTDDLSKFLSNNSVLFKSFAEAANKPVKDYKHMNKIREYNQSLKSKQGSN